MRIYCWLLAAGLGAGRALMDVTAAVSSFPEGSDDDHNVGWQ